MYHPAQVKHMQHLLNGIFRPHTLSRFCHPKRLAQLTCKWESD